MSTKARIAVIGTGWWSTYTHIPALLAHPHAELVAICDRDPQRLRAAADSFQIARTYEDYFALLEQEELDGAVVATNHASHYAVAKACLTHDLHIMVEKPLTLSAIDARDLFETARQHERQLIVGYPYHYTDHVLRAREVLASGALGAVQFVNCTFASHILELLQGHDRAEESPAHFPVHGPGAVYSQPHLSGGGEGHLQITHSAGLMFFVTGLRAHRVHGLMHNHGLALDLVDVMSVEFAGGALGTVGGSGNLGGTNSGLLTLQIFCADGNVVIDALRGTTAIHGRHLGTELLGPPGPSQEIYPRFATSHNLVEVALGRAANGSPAEVGWRTVELLDAAYRSAQADGRAVWVEELYR